jgi:hypothetical protein
VFFRGIWLKQLVFLEKPELASAQYQGLRRLPNRSAID